MRITFSKDDTPIHVIELPEEVVELLDSTRSSLNGTLREAPDFAHFIEVIIFDLYRQMLIQHPTTELLEKRKKLEEEFANAIDGKIQKLRGK
jgi:hypothetical protein